MRREHLLTVEDSFLIPRDGETKLLLVPAFPVPAKGWKNWAGEVTLVRPDGAEAEVPAFLEVIHLRPIDPEAPLNNRWKIVMSLSGLSKEEAPIGSRVECSPELKQALLGAAE